MGWGSILALLCIVAGQRSGTTALQSALGASGQFENLREIFHTGPREGPGGFLDFARDQGLGLADFAIQPKAEAILDRYVDHLIALSAPKTPVIDVKFNSWPGLQPYWSYPHQEPLFMRILKRRGASFIFIRRLNLAEQVLSEQIARHAGIWHGLREDQAQDRFEVDLGQIREQAALVLQAESLYWDFLRHHPRLGAFAYESLFEDEALAADVARFCFESVGRTQQFPLVSPIRKNAGRKGAQITNYAEAIAVVDQVLARFGRSLDRSPTQAG